MSRVSLLAALLGLVSSLVQGTEAAPSATGPQPQTKHRTEAYVFETRSGETVRAELGGFSVPENRAAKGSRQIQLAYVRFPSTSENPGAPIVYLAGGPGGSGIATARGSRFPLFQALRAYGDVIAFDQRGTGMSEADLDCHETYSIPFDTPLSRRAVGDAAGRAARTCAQRLKKAGADLRGYNSLESAHDLEDLRKVLRAEKLSLWGISYGSHLALATLAAHGDRIERMILAGIEGPDDSWKLPSDQQMLMEEIASLVTQNPRVHAVIPDLLGTIRSVLATLAESPQAVELTHPETGQSIVVMLGPLDLQVTLASMLRGPSRFSAMPDFVARLAAGDWMALALSSVRDRVDGVGNAMSLAMDCASGATAGRLAQIAKEAPKTLLADAITLPFPEICSGIAVPDLGDGFRATVRSKVPVLLISGTLDGRTAPRNAERALAGLHNGRHLVIEGAGHSDPLFLSSPKILQAMEEFLRGEETTARIKLDPIQFLEPRKVVAVDAAILQRYVGAYSVPGGDIRKVLRAGSLLFTQRGEGEVLPIRPHSANAFFYEGGSTHLRFDLDDQGAVIGMTMFAGGSEQGETAPRVHRQDAE